MATQTAKKRKLPAFIVLAVSALLWIGVAVPVLRGFLYGIFGYAVYAVALGLTTVAILMFLGKTPVLGRFRVVMSIVTLVSLVALLHVSLVTATATYSTADYFSYCFREETVGGSLTALVTFLPVVFLNPYFAIVIFGIIVAGSLLVVIYPLLLTFKPPVKREKRVKEPRITTPSQPALTPSVLQEAQTVGYSPFNPSTISTDFIKEDGPKSAQPKPVLAPLAETSTRLTEKEKEQFSISRIQQMANENRLAQAYNQPYTPSQNYPSSVYIERPKAIARHPTEEPVVYSEPEPIYYHADEPEPPPAPVYYRVPEYKPEPIAPVYKREPVVKKRETASRVVPTHRGYIAPPIELLKSSYGMPSSSIENFDYYKQRIESALQEFSIDATVVGAMRGPAFTRYELTLAPGQRVNKVSNLIEDLKMRLEVKRLRVLAPIPGKNAIGLEIPNQTREIVGLRSILTSPEFNSSNHGISLALGKDLEGRPQVVDLAEVRHMLIAGSTGTGKSVCVSAILMSIIYKYSPDQVRLVIIDPKQVDMASYGGIPNLLIPKPATGVMQSVNALKWCVKEMNKRYGIMQETLSNNIDYYNAKHAPEGAKLPKIVIIIDEVAELMMRGAKLVENSIVSIAQLGRAAGIHLVLATQSPRADIITGLLKANIPCRIAFQVLSGLESRIVMDTEGAEELLGKGDMLYFYNSGFERIQGALITNDEVLAINDFLRKNNDCDYDDEAASEIFSTEDENSDNAQAVAGMPTEGTPVDASDEDSAENEMMVRKGIKQFILSGRASISSLQSMFKIGFVRATTLMEIMCERGFISASSQSKPRTVLITMDKYNEIYKGFED